ncbi:Fe-S protein assembly co-chaperone HscB [Candidatus Vesicomyidisocius calyptogenae]|uniref:Co-chaperone protein HscB homolog n=1 Tax=Vesicomyosocius okutanii subsp. Calyptogena okutanii (strain HA) TaxID=412965 RepID=A5CWM3_VESOH|nr:Fe-S protein assembly co-chaperone HscB [Candidatus Vesicomyosocius okutanii]BAF61647.1 molecular chaperone HscB [Candidatus Vesicomyosocius okutanii]
MENYFELFSIKPDFNISIINLNAEYQKQIVKFHPDRFITSSAKERVLALQNTSLINTAFDTLKSPLNRANYLLELNGIDAFDEKYTQMDVKFLMNQIELRENLELIRISKDEIRLYDFIEKNDLNIKHNVDNIRLLFTNTKTFNEIKNLVRELKFYEHLNTHAKQLMNEWL